MSPESQVPTEAPSSSFWKLSWEWIKKTARYLAAPLPALILIAVAIVLVILGVKNIQIGGLLAKLFGKQPGTDDGKKVIGVSNSIPTDRVDSQGNLLPPGTPDSKGLTQAKVLPLERPGLFDDPTKVKTLPTDGSDPIILDLPDGVKAKDVDKVIVLKPNIYTVTVKDSSKVTGTDVDELLKKYGG